MFGLYTLCTKRWSKDGYDDSAEIKIDFLLLIFLKILECIWWPLHLIFLFKSKKWLKYHLLAYQIWKQYWQPPQKFLARNYKLNKKRLLILHSLKPKYWNYKVLLGPIISIIRQLNSLLVFFSIQQKRYQNSTLGGPVTKQ